MRVMGFDLGLNCGYAMLQPGERPVAGSFRINRSARDLGHIKIDFEQCAEHLIGRFNPDVIVRATRFINPKSNPIAIGPYFGLSMVLDAMAVSRHIEPVEIDEQGARKTFLGGIPRGSKAIKDRVIAECAARGWPSKDSHTCDAIVVALKILAQRDRKSALAMTPLFGDRA